LRFAPPTIAGQVLFCGSFLVAAVYNCQGFPLPLNAEVLLDPIPWFFERKWSLSPVSPEELQKVTPSAFLELDF
jgi:hypothetical protein